MANNNPPTPPGKPSNRERGKAAAKSQKDTGFHLDTFGDTPDIDVLAASGGDSPSNEWLVEPSSDTYFHREPRDSQESGARPGDDVDKSQREERDREMIRLLQDISSKLDVLAAISSDVSTEGVLIRFP